MEPVLTTKNGRIFEIWELLERVCENPGGAMAPPCPPLPTPMTPGNLKISRIILNMLANFIRSITADNFHLERAKIRNGQRSCSCIGVEIWNNISPTFEELPKYSFSKQIKLSMLSNNY